MTIGARLTLWYAGVLLLSLLVLSGGLYYELVLEPRSNHQHGLPEEGVEAQIREVLLEYELPALIVATIGGWLLTRKALSPLRTLAKAVATLNAQNLHAELPRTKNGDEIDRLGEVFNLTLKRIEASFAQEREFTLHASHELKTPLTVMRSQVETGLREIEVGTAQRDLLESHIEEIARLAAIVDALSFLAKADAGLLPLDKKTVRLDELVHDILADTQILAHPHSISVTLDRCDRIEVNGDRHRLRQLLLNLADNAVKHNQISGSISFSLVRAGNLARLTIQNTGPGIPVESLPRVFDRFYRADLAHNPNIDGSGLGLSIAQSITNAHSGTIQITSSPKITQVVVELPAEFSG